MQEWNPRMKLKTLPASLVRREVESQMHAYRALGHTPCAVVVGGMYYRALEADPSLVFVVGETSRSAHPTLLGLRILMHADDFIAVVCNPITF